MTDATGKESCGDIVISARTVLSRGYQAVFDGDAQHEAASSTGSLVKV